MVEQRDVAERKLGVEECDECHVRGISQVLYSSARSPRAMPTGDMKGGRKADEKKRSGAAKFSSACPQTVKGWHILKGSTGERESG